MDGDLVRHELPSARRLRPSRWVVVLAFALLAALIGRTASAPAADERIAPEGDVRQVLALADRVLYRHDGRWMRVVEGRRSRARGIPPKAEASTIGRDAGGQVVVTFSRFSDDPRPDRRWWLYDVDRDVAHPFAVDTSPRCYAESLAVWRSRIAYGETCWEMIDDPLGPMVGIGGRRVVLEVAGRPRRSFSESYAGLQLALRGPSLGAVVDHDDPITIWRFVDRDRRCPAEVDSVDAEYDSLGPIALGQGRLLWATTDRYWGDAPRYERLLLTDIDMRGRCARKPRVGVVATRAPARGIEAVALDGRNLYYANGDGIFKRRLRSPGTTAAPRNDDFADAAEIAAARPVEVWGRVGYATLEPGEPRFEQATRTTWYTWRPTTSRRVHVWLTYGWEYRLFTGNRLGALAPVSEATFGTSECPLILDERKGERYSLQVGAFENPSLPTGFLRPFRIRIAPSDEPLPPYCPPS